MSWVAADHPPGSTMTFLGVVVFRDNQNTVSRLWPLVAPTAPLGALPQGLEQRFGLRVVPEHHVAHLGVGEAADGHGLRL